MVASVAMARGELREETGLEAGRLDKIGELAMANGFVAQRLHVFVARDLTQGKPQREKTEIDMVHGEWELAEFEAMLKNGTIDDSTTLAAYALAKLHGVL
jgi:8-oxo-dGTP pyrophosphatase MutT (NUDIX family)